MTEEKQTQEDKLRLQHLICYGNYKDEIIDTDTRRLDTALFNAFKLLEDETVWSGAYIENLLYKRIGLLCAAQSRRVAELEKLIDQIYEITDEKEVWRMIEKFKGYIS